MSGLLIAISILNLLSIGYFFSSLLTSHESDIGWRRIAYAPLFGFVLLSISYSFSVLIFHIENQLYFWIETCLGFCLLLATVFFRKSEPVSNFALSKKQLVLFLIVPFIFVGNIGALAFKNPFGFWDAWARMNLKARFLASPISADEAVGGIITQPEYPLLLPSTIARMWMFVGDQPTWVPTLFSILVGFLALAIFGVIVLDRFGHMVAVASMTAVCCCDYLWFWAGLQYADLLFALLVLLSLFELDRLTKIRTANAGSLLVFLAGAIWTKNEGIAFAGIVLASLTLIQIYRIWVIPSQKRIWLAPLIGFVCLTLSTILAAHLKLNAGTAGGLFGGGSSWSDLMADESRHQLIANAFWFSIRGTFNWIGFGFLVLIVAINLYGKVKFRLRSLILVLILLLLASVYYFIYSITSFDLEWHLGTSMDRLILQLWFPLLLSILLCFESEEQENEIAKI